MKTTRSPLTAIAIVLASTTALVTVSDVAMARSGNSGHQDVSHQMNAQPNRKVATGTPSRDMTSQPAVYRQKGSKSGSAEAYKKHKGCGKLIVPTAGCPVPARDPVGNTRPSLPTEAKQPIDKNRQPVLEYATKPGAQSANQPANPPAQRPATPAGPVAANPQGLPPHDPVGNTRPDLNANGVATVSNGVSKATVPNLEGGLLVTSKTPGTITVSNGTNSVTLPGGSVTLSGARSVGGGADVQIVRQPNGNITVAAKPLAPAPTQPTPPPSGPAPASGGNHNAGPGSVTITTTDVKTGGEVIGAVVAAPVVVNTAVGGGFLTTFAVGTAAIVGGYSAEGAAQVGATAVLPIAGAIAGYGLAKGGVSGAGDALKDSAGAVKDVTKDAAGAVKDAAKDVGGAVKDVAGAIGDLF